MAVLSRGTASEERRREAGIDDAALLDAQAEIWERSIYGPG